jgi:hypothetical protein
LAQCSSCSDCYHLRCTANPRLTKETYTEAMAQGWMCEDCVCTRPPFAHAKQKEHCCEICNKIEQIDSKDLKFCSRCDAFFHPTCLIPAENENRLAGSAPASGDSSSSSDDEDWICSDCVWSPYLRSHC